MKKLRFVSQWVLPTLPFTIWSNRNEIPETPDNLSKEELHKKYAEDLVNLTIDQRNAIVTVYADSQDRFTILESKATGVLTAIAIIAALATFACTGSFASATFGSLALLFLTSGGVACCLVLLPKTRYVLSVPSVVTTDPVLAAAFCARMSENQTLRMANLITSAMRDLLRALVLTLFAVILFIIIG